MSGANKIKLVVIKTDGDIMKVATEDRRFLTLPMPENDVFPGETLWMDSETLEDSASAVGRGAGTNEPAAREKTAAPWERWWGVSRWSKAAKYGAGTAAAALLLLLLSGWFWHVLAPLSPGPTADPRDPALPEEQVVLPVPEKEKEAPGEPWDEEEPVTYLALDINPSLELAIDENNRVVELIPYNEPGEAVAEQINLEDAASNPTNDSHATRRDALSVLKAIIREAEALGYISPAEETMILLTLIEAHEEALEETLEGELEDIEAHEAVEVVNAETHEFAHGEENEEAHDGVHGNVNGADQSDLDSRPLTAQVLKEELTDYLNELEVDGQIGIQQADRAQRDQAREDGVSVNNHVLRENASREAEIPEEELAGKGNREVLAILEDKELPPGQIFQEFEGFPPGRNEAPGERDDRPNANAQPGREQKPEEHPGEDKPPEEPPGQEKAPEGAPVDSPGEGEAPQGPSEKEALPGETPGTGEASGDSPGKNPGDPPGKAERPEGASGKDGPKEDVPGQGNGFKAPPIDSVSF